MKSLRLMLLASSLFIFFGLFVKAETETQILDQKETEYLGIQNNTVQARGTEHLVDFSELRASMRMEIDSIIGVYKNKLAAFSNDLKSRGEESSALAASKDLESLKQELRLIILRIQEDYLARMGMADEASAVRESIRQIVEGHNQQHPTSDSRHGQRPGSGQRR